MCTLGRNRGPRQGGLWSRVLAQVTWKALGGFQPRPAGTAEIGLSEPSEGDSIGGFSRMLEASYGEKMEAARHDRLPRAPCLECQTWVSAVPSEGGHLAQPLGH